MSKFPLSKKIVNTKDQIDLYCDTVSLRVLFCQQNICNQTCIFEDPAYLARFIWLTVYSL